MTGIELQVNSEHKALISQTKEKDASLLICSHALRGKPLTCWIQGIREVFLASGQELSKLMILRQCQIEILA